MQTDQVMPWDHSKQIIAPVRTLNEVISDAPATKFVADKEFVTTLIGMPTPDVSNQTHFNAGGGVINNFTGGQPGQNIYILGDGVTVINHIPGVIYTNTQAAITLAANLVYHFALFGNQWSQSA